MTLLESIYNLATLVLTFWIPIAYSFKFLMDKQLKQIRTILKFWSIICCYQLISLVFEGILDQNVFPWLNIILLGILCLPPYEIVQKVYDMTLGNIFVQNKEHFLSVEKTVVAIFDKNAEKLSQNVQQKTGQKMKGIVGGVLAAAISSSSNQAVLTENSKRKDDDDEDSDNSDKSD